MTPFKLGTFRAADGPPFAGLVLADEGPVYRIAALTGSSASLREMLDDWATTLPRLVEAAERAALGEGEATQLSALTVLPPVTPPGQLFQTGANYRSHVWQIECGMRRQQGQTAEQAASAEERGKFDAQIAERIAEDPPLIFSGVSHAISGAYDDIVLPSRHGQNPDWELELGVVFGREARYVEPDRALDHVAGYVIANDLSHRPDRTKKQKFQLGADWLAMKNSPTFTPTGPYLVPALFVPDPMALQIVLKLNGETRQDESTGDMIYGVREQISRLSHVTVVKPGDMLLTGSPSGNGLHDGRFLQPGDVLESSITGLGTQRNRVVAEAAA